MVAKIVIDKVAICSSCGAIGVSEDKSCRNCNSVFSDEVDLNELKRLIEMLGSEELEEEEREGACMLLNGILTALEIEGDVCSDPTVLMSLLGVFNKVNDFIAKNAKEVAKQIEDKGLSKNLKEIVLQLYIGEKINTTMSEIIDTLGKISAVQPAVSQPKPAEVQPPEGVSVEEWMKEHEKIQEDLLKLREDVVKTSAKKKEYEKKIEKLNKVIEDMKKNEEEVKKVLKVLDDLLGKLPKEVIDEFAVSENFALYKKVMVRFGLA